MPKKINTVGLNMPDDFPAEAYNAVYTRVSPKQKLYPIPWPEWAGAWNALAYRFQSLADHDAAFTGSVRNYGDAPGHEERYLQERELFSFFVTGLSAIECFCYGIYAIVSMIDPTNFPMATFQDRKRVTPQKTADLFDKHFQADAMTVTLQRLLGHTEFEKWEGWRNLLAHRVTPGRALTLARTGGAWKDVELKTGKETLTIDTNTTSSRRAWLSKTLGDLLTESGAFTDRHMP
jgi:hypothetical protein